jgi:hypothetical protein
MRILSIEDLKFDHNGVAMFRDSEGIQLIAARLKIGHDVMYAIIGDEKETWDGRLFSRDDMEGFIKSRCHPLI